MQTTVEQPLSITREETIREAKRIEESLLYSSKGHFYAANFWSHFHLVVGLPLVILSAIAATAVVKKDPDGFWALAIPVAVAVLSAMITFLNPSEKAASHLKAGNEYDSLMNRARIFWAIECVGEEADRVIASRVQDFSREKDKLNKSSPQIPFWAFRWARAGIIRGEGDFSANESAK